jgi:hypothetical protein
MYHCLIISDRPIMNNAASLHKDKSPLVLLLLHGCCALVVVLYVHLFAIFRILRDLLGSGFISLAPLLLPLLLGVLLAPVIISKRRENSISWKWLLAGCFLTIAALCVPDPDFAVKRIHVTEYILLSLLVRFTLSHRHSGITLFIYGCLLTSLLGVHDEILQGLHPSRTYGHRDIAVNSLSAIAGNCLWHGLILFQNRSTAITCKNKSPEEILYILWLITSVVLFAVPIIQYRHDLIPLWTVLPLFASLFIWSVLFTGTNWHTSSLNSLSFYSFSLLLYPVIINVFQVPFY